MTSGGAPRSILAFGEDWGGLPSSTQHLLGRLAKDRDILWVNSIGLRRPRLDRRDLCRVVGKLRAAMGGGAAPARRAAGLGAAGFGAVEPPARLAVIAPHALSWPGSRLVEAINRRMLGGQLRGELARRGMVKPLFWASLPSAAAVLDAVPHGPVVYYCGDDFSALAGVDHRPVAELERRLVARANLILAASPELAARFPASKTILLPHGVDYELFSRPAPRAPDLPSGGPVAGFYGSLAEWVDVGLIAAAARALPHWRFELIGEAQTDLSALDGLPNLWRLGPRPHAALPSYVQHWDVALLPFRDNEQIRACNPLKLREYLAAGAPVAATWFPALAPYRELISIARGPEDFAQAILRAAGERDAAPARRARVAGESWDARARDLAARLEAL